MPEVLRADVQRARVVGVQANVLLERAQHAETHPHLVLLASHRGMGLRQEERRLVVGRIDLRRLGVELGRLPRVTLRGARSEEHTSELQSLMRNSYAVFCLKKKKNK